MSNKTKKRKGFSLVELVIVILVIAVLALAVFAGGSVVVKKSQVSRTISDLHNFSVAVESTLNENPNVANIQDGSVSPDTIQDILVRLNANLPEDYRFDTTAITAAQATGNIQYVAQVTGTGLYKSTKQDSWGNEYYVLLDYRDTDSAKDSEFFITIISAGPNAQTALNGTINSDDIFLLGHYRNGDVSVQTYNQGDPSTVAYDNHKVKADGTKATVYQAANRAACPSNFFTVEAVAP